MSYRTQLLPCAICGRKFQIARLKDHEDICRRVTENAKRRGVFNATRQRKLREFIILLVFLVEIFWWDVLGGIVSESMRSFFLPDWSSSDDCIVFYHE